MDSPTTLSSLTTEPQDLLREKLLAIPEYSQRQELHNELNSVAYELLAPPVQLSHLVLMSERHWIDQERKLIGELCDRYGITPPNTHENDFSADFGEFRLRWERHTEYSTYTVYRAKPFVTPFEKLQIEMSRRLSTIYVAL